MKVIVVLKREELKEFIMKLMGELMTRAGKEGGSLVLGQPTSIEFSIENEDKAN